MLYTLLNLLLLIGGIQGIVFTLIVITSKRFRGRSNIFLALLILCFSLNNLQYLLLNSEILTPDKFFQTIFIPYGSISMVFYYFYVKTYLGGSNKISKGEMILFLPFVFFFGATVYYKTGEIFQWFSESEYQFFSRLLLFYENSSWLFSMILLLMAYKQIRKFEIKELKDQNKHGPEDINWLKSISIISLVLCLLWVVAIFNNHNPLPYYLLWTGMSVAIYILGHIGLYKFGLKSEREKIRKFYNNNPAKPVELPVLEIEPLKESQNIHIIDFERFIRDEKNYLNNQLSLDMVANQLGVNKSYLSRLINSELHVNFSDYINQLRVEEVKKYFENRDFSNYTITAMGLEAGFNSKSVFNNAFKKFTGMSPTEYRKKVKVTELVQTE